MSKPKYYLTTPIYYVNARPHIGHAYTTLTADTIARRKRLEGFDVRLLTGTDEHGQKIQRSAEAAGIAPQQFTDQVSKTFEDLWKRMGITYDDYIRTTEPRHKLGVEKLFKALQENGSIYLDSYTGAYCVSDETFVDVPVGTPCPDCGKITEEVTEENYFFQLSKFGDQLLALYESGEFAIEPAARRNEIISFVKGGLKDLSISRTSFSWGIPVPGNDKHVIYVWLDALANYMTALGYGSSDESLWQKYWPADLHLVGKEIIRFHCVYWPAFLLAAGLPLPKKVQAHGWLLFEESKMSKSRGNIVRSETILDAFGSLKPELSKTEQDLFAADVLRYFLLREIPFGQDGSFSFDALVTRYNADLANGYGNLVSRTLSMIEQNFNGYIPGEGIVGIPGGEHWVVNLGEIETLCRPIVENLLPWQRGLEAAYLAEFSGLNFDAVLRFVFATVASIDGLITATKPWKLAKSSNDEDRQNLAAVLFTCGQAIRHITALLYPFLPYATAKVWQQLGLGDIELAARNGELNNLQWGGLQPGTKLGTLAPIFPRADKELIKTMNEAELNNKTSIPSTEGENKTSVISTGAEGAVEKPASEAGTQTIAPPADTAVAEAEKDQPITIDDFIKVELRTAIVKHAERIPKADKLLRLEVDMGAMGQRQILSGIAEWYTPEDLIGRRIVVVANLAPRKMRGLESHGMLLAASEGDTTKPVLATFSEDIAPGSRVR